jgi:hypothetical protein
MRRRHRHRLRDDPTTPTREPLSSQPEEGPSAQRDGRARLPMVLPAVAGRSAIAQIVSTLTVALLSPTPLGVTHPGLSVCRRGLSSVGCTSVPSDDFSKDGAGPPRAPPSSTACRSRRTYPRPPPPDFDRVDRIGAFWGNPKTRSFAELLIDCEEDRTLRAVLVEMLAEMERT